MCFHARRRSNRRLVVYSKTGVSQKNVSHRGGSAPSAIQPLSSKFCSSQGYQVRTWLLSVSGIASSSLTDVWRVKLLLTVAERIGSLCSTGLTGVDMSADGDIV